MKEQKKNNSAENASHTSKRGRKRAEDLRGIIHNRLEYIDFFLDAYLSGDFGYYEGKGLAPLARFFDGQENLPQ